VTGAEKIEQDEGRGFTERVKGAVLWRSGSQLVAQLITWASTFVVIRLLVPEDYGLFAMAQVLLVFLNLMNGHGFANALVRSESVTRQQIAQVFGMLLLVNGALALGQLLLAPVAAAYFRQPIVADLLRAQCVLYLFTPFISLPTALLSRGMNFKRQAQVDLVAALAGAGTALGCAAAGIGVWTLVAAPIVLFGTRALGLMLAARCWIRPSFRFAGSGAFARYGGAMMGIQLFWFVQSQADVFIAGRTVSAHELGLYTTALFLTQVLSAKFVPPLNEVAFSAYSRIQTDRSAVAMAFVKAVRLVMLVAFPFYFGLAATAEPIVLTVLGPKWAETVPLVQLLALAMPFMTLQILFAPATNAVGREAVALRVAMCGAVILPAAFLVGVRFGIVGMAYAWLIGMPLLLVVSAALSLPAIGLSAATWARSASPGFFAAAGMVLVVLGLGALLPPLPPPARLAILVPAGTAAYGALLFLFGRTIVEEVLALLRRQPARA